MLPVAVRLKVFGSLHLIARNDTTTARSFDNIAPSLSFRPVKFRCDIYLM